MDQFSDDLLTSREAKKKLQVSLRTLASWRSQQIGPAYYRLGRGGRSVRYRKHDLDAWLSRHHVKTQE